MKTLGKVLLAGGGLLLCCKLLNMMATTKSQRSEQLTQAVHEKKNLSFSEGEFVSMANSLHNALKNTQFWVRSIDENTIISVLSKLKNKDDWGALVDAFGIRYDKVDDAKYTLMDYLRLDDESDQARYQDILDKIGVHNVLN